MWQTGSVALGYHLTIGDSDILRIQRTHPSSTDLSAFSGYRFPPEIIMLAVRWYLRYGLSYRDVEELLAERGIEVDHVTIYRRVQRFTPLLIDAALPCRHTVGNRWFVDETYVKVSGTWRYVYRAVDQHGQVIDVYVSKRRNIPAARTFFKTVLLAHDKPVEVVTDLAQALETLIEEQIPNAFHNTEREILGCVDSVAGEIERNQIGIACVVAV
ncbi:MAG: IS6 family transposase [bacterium]|nr:IS6 family transposase [bacterium]